jgi:hypothetical protein
MTELATNTITADTRIGSHSEAMVIIAPPSVVVPAVPAEPAAFIRLYRETVPGLMSGPACACVGGLCALAATVGFQPPALRTP